MSTPLTGLAIERRTMRPTSQLSWTEELRTTALLPLTSTPRAVEKRTSKPSKTVPSPLMATRGAKRRVGGPPGSRFWPSMIGCSPG